MSSRYENLQANVLRILEPAKLGDRTSKIWDLSLFGLVVLNLIAVALESVPALQKNYGSWFYNFEIFLLLFLQSSTLLGYGQPLQTRS
ncbi:MAG: hypothetical protein CM15mP85_04070 [Rhodobacterales bacterium]|nr:MAG: hypothetical protein CM15mP85_04070 [Rhodobacterales bacterium]